MGLQSFCLAVHCRTSYREISILNLLLWASGSGVLETHLVKDALVSYFLVSLTVIVSPIVVILYECGIFKSDFI